MIFTSPATLSINLFLPKNFGTPCGKYFCSVSYKSASELSLNSSKLYCITHDMERFMFIEFKNNVGYFDKRKIIYKLQTLGIKLIMIFLIK